MDRASAEARPYRGGVTGDSELRDEDLEREIELVGALVLAAAQSGEQLPQEQIDAVLGIEPEGPAHPETG